MRILRTVVSGGLDRPKVYSFRGLDGQRFRACAVTIRDESGTDSSLIMDLVATTQDDKPDRSVD